MPAPTNAGRFTNHRFPGAMSRHGVWLCSRCTLSDRDGYASLYEGGLTVSHEAIRTERQKFHTPPS